MRKLSLLLCALLVAACLVAPVRASVPEEISAQAAVLMDAETGQVLYEKRAHERRQPASITKILTALLVLENLEDDRVLTASAQAVAIPSWGSSAYIQAGERLTVEQAMYAMMLRSANEAANILAEGVSGSMSSFAALMNRRASELGAMNTHFINPSGLPERGHYTTAYDMAVITRQALQTPGFLDYFGRDSYTMEATNRAGARVFTNTHRMLLDNYAVYDETVLGGKTGYTVPAGYTLVTAAQRNGRTLICVVLKSDSYYADTRALLQYGFEEFEEYLYLFEEAEPAEVSIWEGDWEAGRATFYQPRSASLLLHESVDPSDITTEYSYPEGVGEEEIEGRVTLRLSGYYREQGLPDTLLDVPLAVEVTRFEPPAVQALADIPLEEEGQALQFGLRTAVILMVLSGVLCFVVLSRTRQRL